MIRNIFDSKYLRTRTNYTATLSLCFAYMCVQHFVNRKSAELYMDHVTWWNVALQCVPTVKRWSQRNAEITPNRLFFRFKFGKKPNRRFGIGCKMEKMKKSIGFDCNCNKNTFPQPISLFWFKNRLFSVFRL